MSMVDEMDEFSTTDRDPDAPAVPFSEDQALEWLKANPNTSIRMAAKLWGWSVGKVQRFLERAQTDSAKPSESPKTDSPTDSPGTESIHPHPVDDFDFKRSECILPARTAVSAYIDDNGDLRLWADDLLEQTGITAVRINAEDIESFLLGVNDIVSRHLGHCVITGRTVPK